MVNILSSFNIIPLDFSSERKIASGEIGRPGGDGQTDGRIIRRHNACISYGNFRTSITTANSYIQNRK